MGVHSVVTRFNLISARGRKRIVQKLWQDFFSDPSQWWDNRSEKDNARYPDFKNRRTQDGLWLDGKLNPPWVEEKISAMVPGAVKSSIASWNRRLARYVKAGDYKKTVELFNQLQWEGMNPDKFTFVQVLNACAGLKALEEGKSIHAQIRSSGCHLDGYVGNCLVDMYVKCGSLEDAVQVFDDMPVRDVVGWSAIITGYVKFGQGWKALELYQQMHAEGVEPDPVTFVGLLRACASVSALKEGRRVHQQVIERGYESDVYVGSSLIDMYSKCGSTADARMVFDKIPKHDVVTWSAMILGYVKCGEGQRALKLAQQMRRQGVPADPFTFVVMLNSCTSAAALQEGRLVHEHIIQHGFETDLFVGSALVDMYSKCGSLEDAHSVFKTMPTHDAGTWNAMLGGYAMHGCVKEALEHFTQMCKENIKPNGITFLSLLSACSHGGLVNEGLYYFESMGSIYGLSPKIDHYACLVDLLGRAGHMHAAEDLIKTMSHVPNAVVWRSVLGACRVHGNVEMVDCILKNVMELNPENDTVSVLLANT